nr:hypothetical protein GCM10020063_017780 [Dactylosporangium thailandense]
MAWQVRRAGALAAAPPHPLPAGERAAHVDRTGWSGPFEPPTGRQSPAVFAGAYLPLLPAGGSATIWGEETGIRFSRDGGALVAVVAGADGEDEPPVRLAPLDAWPLVRDRLR